MVKRFDGNWDGAIQIGISPSFSLLSPAENGSVITVAGAVEFPGPLFTLELPELSAGGAKRSRLKSSSPSHIRGHGQAILDSSRTSVFTVSGCYRRYRELYTDWSVLVCEGYQILNPNKRTLCRRLAKAFGNCYLDPPHVICCVPHWISEALCMKLWPSQNLPSPWLFVVPTLERV